MGFGAAELGAADETAVEEDGGEEVETEDEVVHMALLSPGSADDVAGKEEAAEVWVVEEEDTENRKVHVAVVLTCTIGRKPVVSVISVV